MFADNLLIDIIVDPFKYFQKSDQIQISDRLTYTYP